MRPLPPNCGGNTVGTPPLMAGRLPTKPQPTTLPIAHNAARRRALFLPLAGGSHASCAGMLAPAVQSLPAGAGQPGHERQPSSANQRSLPRRQGGNTCDITTTREACQALGCTISQAKNCRCGSRRGRAVLCPLPAPACRRSAMAGCTSAPCRSPLGLQRHFQHRVMGAPALGAGPG